MLTAGTGNFFDICLFIVVVVVVVVVVVLATVCLFT
jgi:hypothetical protein